MVSSVKLSLYRVSTATSEVIFSKDALLKIGVKAGEELTFKIGPSIQFKAQITQNSHRKASLGLPAMIFDEHVLSLVETLRVIRRGDTIHLGPVIGIMSGGKFDPERQYLQDLLQTAQVKGYMAYLFSAEDYNWGANTVTGELIAGQRQPHLPLPSAIYNRVHEQDIDSKLKLEALKSRMRSLGVQIYNPGFFDKWVVYTHLSQAQKLKKYLPETHRTPTLPLLNKILNRHSSAYLKPVDGKNGSKLMRLAKLSKGYRLHWITDLSCPYADFIYLEEAFEFAFCHTALDQYIIQQTVELGEFEGNLVDCRVQMHKDISGHWQCLLIAPRVYAKDCITSHFSHGSYLVEPSDYFSGAFGDSASDVVSAVEECGFAIARQVDTYPTAPIGEIGLDIGIDRSGNPKLLDINAKPGRAIFRGELHATAAQATLKASLDFGAYLSNFGR